MPIPSLTHEGYLPVGVHECTFDEIGGVFGQFQKRDRRSRLYENLEAFIAEAQSSGLIIAVVINGSFATAKDEPSDLDLIVILPKSHDFSAQLRPFEYNLLSRRSLQRRFGFDVLVAQQNQTELDEYVSFFAQIRGEPYKRKDMLKVML